MLRNVIIFALVTLLAAGASPHRTAQAQPYAIDGDTFVNDMGQHVRIYGIDAPELTQQCDGQPVGLMAKQRLAELLKQGSNLHCQNMIPNNTRDRYGRVIALCTIVLKDDKSYQTLDIGKTLVAEGLAYAYRRYTNTYVSDEGWGPVAQYHCENPETYRHKNGK